MTTTRFLQRRWLEPALVVLGFALLAIVATWPVAADAGAIIPSPGSAWDPAGFIWDFWQRSVEGLGVWGDASSRFAGYPFGRGFPAAADAMQLVTYGPAWVITSIAGPVVAYNVVIISGLAFAGMAMYALARWLHAGPGAAAWAGGAYVIFPYEIGKAIVHAPLVHLACFPLAVLAGLWWSERPTWRRALVVVAAYGFAWLTNPYYGLMATVILLVVCGGGLVRIARATGAKAAAVVGGTLAGLLALLVVIPVGLIGRSATNETTSGVSRQAIDLDHYGARLTDFITPPGNGFLMRGIDPEWVGVDAIGDERRLLYLGITTLAIAIFGAVVAWGATGTTGPRIRLAARTSAVLAVVLAWFSLASPTTWLGIDIPVPSLWVWEAQPQFRVFARFAAPLMCAVLVLGVLGLRWIVNRRSGPLWRNSIVAAAMLVTATDLATTLPTPTAPPTNVNGQQPDQVPAWAWLRDQPGTAAVVQYPTVPEEFTPSGESLERIYAIGQTVHGRPSVNGALFPGQRSFDFLAQVSNPLRTGTATDLATAGVRWAVINPWAYTLLTRAPALDPGGPPPGFRVEKVFADDTAIWRVTARPRDGLVVFRSPGFGWGVPAGGVTWHAIQAGTASVTLWSMRAGTYRVTLLVKGADTRTITATAKGSPLTVTSEDGRIQLQATAGPDPTEVELTIPQRDGDAGMATAGMRRVR